MVREAIDDSVLASDGEMEEAARLFFSGPKVVAEPTRAASLAAVLAGRLNASGNIACVISGGNISGEQFCQIVGKQGR